MMGTLMGSQWPSPDVIRRSKLMNVVLFPKPFASIRWHREQLGQFLDSRCIYSWLCPCHTMSLSYSLMSAPTSPPLGFSFSELSCPFWQIYSFLGL